VKTKANRIKLGSDARWNAIPISV